MDKNWPKVVSSVTLEENKIVDTALGSLGTLVGWVVALAFAIALASSGGT